MLRAPRAPLRPFVRSLWTSDSLDVPAAPGAREHAIPTGEMHLVIRLSDVPVRLFADDDDLAGHVFGHALVAGPRSAYHVRDVSSPFSSVGVQLHPASSSALFGAPAEAFAERHVTLDEVWGPGAGSVLRERLLEAGDPAGRLDVLERTLAERLPRVQGIHPAVALALDRFRTVSEVAPVVRESGYSHRALVALFRQAMGLTPKRYVRLMRIRRVLRRIGQAPLADLALDAGFSDQAHLAREFREITGVSPTGYLQSRPMAVNHVRILQDARTRRR